MPKARKKSADPVQEALRQHKSDWKDSQKEFVAHLMGLKNGINGRGDNRFGIPPSNIKDPLPGEVASLLGSLTSQFQSLVGGASALIQEQDSYSKHRRKKQEKKKENRPQAPIAEPNQNPSTESNTEPVAAPRNNGPVDGFLSNIASYESVEKYGSNKVTRLWQYIKSPFNRNQFNTKRISLLSSAADIYYGLLDLENAALSLGDDSIPNATTEYQNVITGIKEFKRTLIEDVAGAKPVEPNNQPPTEDAKPSFTEGQPPASETMESAAKLPPQEETANVLQGYNKDLHTIISSSLPLKKEVIYIINLITKFRNAQEEKKDKLASDILYQIDKNMTQLKMVLAAMVDQEPNEIKRKQLKEIIANTDFNYNQIIKLSHNYVTRLLKKYWLGLRKSNKTSFHRLNISRRVEVIIKHIQNIMNDLEKTINVQFIEAELSSVLKETQLMQQSIRTLNLAHQAKLNKEYSKRDKNNKSVMDTVLQNEYRKNLKNVIF